tara:strand:- start:2563 stop:2808 length:246 start_codon:yes stop_codon:yes gene_type:complete
MSNPRKELAQAFEAFETYDLDEAVDKLDAKWHAYGIALKLLLSRKVTRLDIYDAAHDVGIRPSVVDMRLHYLKQLGSEAKQ